MHCFAKNKCSVRLLLVDRRVFGASCCSEEIHTLTASKASEWRQVGFHTAGSVCVEFLQGVYKAVSFAKPPGCTICLCWIYFSAHLTGSRELETVELESEVEKLVGHRHRQGLFIK